MSVLGSVVHAQIDISDKVVIGHSWTVGNRGSNSNYEYAFHPFIQVGRTALFPIGDNVGIGLGTLFSTEGVTFKNKTDDSKAEQRMNYIRIPLTANFTFGSPENRVRPRLGIGGSVGFLVGGKTYLQNKDDGLAGAKTTKIMDTKVDAGATASLGLSVRVIDGVWLNHDISYYHGVVTNKYSSDVLPSFTQRNLGLNLGFTITGDAMRKWKGNMHHKY